MPAVLVHGVPETPAIWEPVISHLGRTDVVTPQFPGFGRPRPAGFGATKEEYLGWLVGELDKLRSEGPIDLVGHDWGGGLVVRLVSTRADLVRSWVTDAAGLGDVNFEWHDFAKIWQTPGEGEAFFEQQLGASEEERLAIFEMFGVPKDQLDRLSTIDSTMTDCILALYRSATNVGKEWAPDFKDIPKPGAVIVPSEDPFLNGDGARNGAKQSGASVIELDGVGHWWMLQDPKRGAAELEKFWGTLTG
ncbi:MAG TPA: alpha/beta hydrolase [Acidimicrobiales bacterium]|jgi:pimeloyl-ACP methyl ester carboxylesterase|nr:alpha/beta hydrolase [Acidimicrobiales bacterium]